MCLLRDVEEEEAADLGAFQREYEDDHSWEALQEDEFGRLRPLVRLGSRGLTRRAYASDVCLLLGCVETSLWAAVHNRFPWTWLLDLALRLTACSTRRGSNAPSIGRCPAQRQHIRHASHQPAPGQQPLVTSFRKYCTTC